MYDFALQIIAVLSGAVMIYILSRALPRVAESVGATETPFLMRVDRWFKKLPLRKIDEWFLEFLEKFLRKIRILNLKVENAVNSGIGKLRRGEDLSKKEGDKKDLFIK